MGGRRSRGAAKRFRTRRLGRSPRSPEFVPDRALAGIVSPSTIDVVAAADNCLVADDQMTEYDREKNNSLEINLICGAICRCKSG